MAQTNRLYYERKYKTLVEIPCAVCGDLFVRPPREIPRSKYCSVDCRNKTLRGLVERHTSTYHIWASMMQRCSNPKRRTFKHYGGRGICVADRWKSYDSFYADMGERPPGMTLDRIDVNGNYEAANCRWASMKTQNRNRRNNKLSYEAAAEIKRLWAIGFSQSSIAKKFGVCDRTVQCVRLGITWANESA